MFVDQYLANVTIFAGNFAPRGWAFCQGQLMSISEYTALFALIGTTYGGDGQVTFALPDLRSRVAVHAGQAPGLSTYIIGQAAGTENVTILTTQLASHTHTFVSATGKPTANSAVGTVADPTNAVPAALSINAYNSASSGSVMGTATCTATTAPTGQTNPTPIISPFLAMNYIIALEGIFPSRN
ncbi:phage tail protein [Paraflavitalea soli]|uniref:Phage tail protein n=1 Tax=Paraflavitalea soli TaxID=2315862 RepID=A0A3B7MMT6_9BACT|nr:tail fiber protein [Paraflavitalea soli]AXY75047.1 phage tail protein [Paraflavitalea soli]